MGIGSLFKKTDKGKVKIVLFLDGGKGNVRGAVVEMRGHIPHVLYATTHEERVGMLETKEALPLALTSLQSTLQDIAQALNRLGGNLREYTAEEVYCVLAEPYYLSHINIINHLDNKPFIVNKNLIQSLLQRQSEELPASHKEVIIGDKPAKIHERIITFKLNGYPTNYPYEKIANSFQIAVFRTLIDVDLINQVSKIIKKVTPAPVYIEPFSLVSYVAARDQVDAKEDYLLVSIGSDVSELTLVKSHMPLETVSFPFGRHTMARLISEKRNILGEEALTRLELFDSGKLSVAEQKDMTPLIEDLRALWSSYFEKAVVNLSTEVSIPDHIYVIVDSSLKNIFTANLAHKGFASQALVPQGFAVEPIDTNRLSKLCTFGLDVHFDVMIATMAIFAANERHNIETIYNK